MLKNRKNLDSTGSLGGKNITFNINPVQSGVTYLYPLKNQKKLSFFFMFSGGIDKQHRALMA